MNRTQIIQVNRQVQILLLVEFLSQYLHLRQLIQASIIVRLVIVMATRTIIMVIRAQVIPVVILGLAHRLRAVVGMHAHATLTTRILASIG